MRRALALARRMLGRTSPNPAVGCVIVRGGRIVGQGATAAGGRPHAEAMALATRLANGPTHAYGRTKALLKASVGQMLNAQLQRETESFAACAASEEFVEGVRAFLEKRRPDFSGARQS